MVAPYLSVALAAALPLAVVYGLPMSFSHQSAAADSIAPRLASGQPDQGLAVVVDLVRRGSVRTATSERPPIFYPNCTGQPLPEPMLRKTSTGWHKL